MNKILFLDIDGVLRRIGEMVKDDTFGLPILDNDCIVWLNFIISKTDCEIVISSDWRKKFAFETIKKFFKHSGIIKEPIDVTSMIDVFPKSKSFDEDIINRRTQIENFVKSNNIVQFAVLDDIGLNMKKEFKEFVYIDGLDGLSEETANLTIDILK